MKLKKLVARSSTNDPLRSKTDPRELVRLSKLMSERGMASRREADDLITQGYVYVDGNQVAELGKKFPANVRITLDPQALRDQKSLVTLILNKPVGLVSAQPEKGYKPAVTLIVNDNQFGPSERKLRPSDLDQLAVVGRLDIDSHGLLLFTQDGRIAKKIIGQDSEIEKEYLVKISNFSKFSKVEIESKIELLCYGIILDGSKLKRAQVKKLNDQQLQFILTEGKKRQIRRMCEYVGFEIQGLKRVRIGPFRLGQLPLGKWRFIEPDEIKQLNLL
jgi:23S rRNA pseudouridine2604 synthase